MKPVAAPYSTPPRWTVQALLCTLALVLGAGTWAADEHTASHGAAPAASAASAPTPATTESPAAPTKKIQIPSTTSLPHSASAIAEKIRAAMSGTVVSSKKMTVVVDSKDSATPAANQEPTAAAVAATPLAKPSSGKRSKQAHGPAATAHTAATAKLAESHGAEVHWSYAGETGPQTWGQLKPEFNLCAIGRRQSPINIEEGSTLRGPAEALQFDYVPSVASVVNNGHTIQVDVLGDNVLTVRDSHYRLVQFHFHAPSEEQIQFKRAAMVVHLVHKNAEGQLAVVAVLLEPGEANTLIDKVWTYMPLDAGDRVRMPANMLNLNELLPADQRYYQFMGSLTTPPCTEGVLWMVLKQPMGISQEQLKLFTQLYPHNARPVQPVNDRAVREAQ